MRKMSKNKIEYLDINQNEYRIKYSNEKMFK